MTSRYPTPEQMYVPGVPHRKLDLVCHQHKGSLRFSTPAEYAALGRTGAPRWAGTIAVEINSRGGAYAPGIDERLMNGPHHDQAQIKVLTEGVLVS